MGISTMHVDYTHVDQAYTAVHTRVMTSLSAHLGEVSARSRSNYCNAEANFQVLYTNSLTQQCCFRPAPCKLTPSVFTEALFPSCVLRPPAPPAAETQTTNRGNNNKKKQPTTSSSLLTEQFRDAQGHRARPVTVQPPSSQAEPQGGRGRHLRRVERGAHGHRERVSGCGDMQLRPVYHAGRRAGTTVLKQGWVQKRSAYVVDLVAHGDCPAPFLRAR